MSDESALLAAILAHPDEDTPRLMYADWLDEHGQPERAEFIRLQCRLARMRDWEEGFAEAQVRAERLFREHWPRWAPRTGRTHWKAHYGASGFRPVRGLIGRADVYSNFTPALARRWFARHPIAEAEVGLGDPFGGDPKLWRLTTDALPHLRSLAINAQYSCTDETRAAACRALAAAESRAGLTRLEFAGDPTVEGLEAVVTSPHLRRLEAISVRGDAVGDGHARVLAGKANLPALRELVLGHGGGLTPGGAEALGRAGIRFRDLNTRESSLEEIFVRLVKEP